MKKMVIAMLASIVLAGMLPTMAANDNLGSLASVAGMQEDKVKIKKEELPEAARKTLDGDAFKGWAVANVFKLKDGSFEVELKKDETMQKLAFDKSGKVK